MTQFIEQLVGLVLIIILSGFSLATYRMVYAKLKQIEKLHGTAKAPTQESVVRRRNQGVRKENSNNES